MPRLIAVYDDSKIVNCLSEFAGHVGYAGKCLVYESVNRDPGKKWFYE